MTEAQTSSFFQNQQLSERDGNVRAQLPVAKRPTGTAASDRPSKRKADATTTKNGSSKQEKRQPNPTPPDGDNGDATQSATTTTHARPHSGPKKRNKPSLVCSNCKKRKIKCDRRLPCSSCVKMKCGYECSYEPKWQSMSFDSKARSSKDAPGASAIADDTSISGPTAGRLPLAGPWKGPIEQGGVDRTAQGSVSLTPTTSDSRNDHSSAGRGDSVYSSLSMTDPQSGFPGVAPPSSQGQGDAAALSLKTSEEPDAENFASYDPQSQLRDPTLAVNPIGAPDEEINFYDDYNPFHVKEPFRRVNHSPLSWAVFMKKDPWLLVIWLFAESEKEGFPCLLFTGAPEVTDVNIKDLNADEKSTNPDVVFKKRALEFDGYDEVAPLDKLRRNITPPDDALPEKPAPGTAPTQQHKQQQQQQQQQQPPSQQLPQQQQQQQQLDGAPPANGSLPTCGTYSTIATLNQSLFQGKVNRELQIVSQIRASMPKKKVIWMLLDRFFNHLYAFMPFLDELDFKTKIGKIIGPESFEDEPVQDIKIINKLDLANISILFIVLRLSYFSVFDNKVALNEKIMNEPTQDKEMQDLRYLMLHPVNLSVVEVAKNCLNKFQFSRKTNLTVFQGFCFIRLYNIFAPEEGDGHDGGDSRVSNGMLIQSAYNLGLNREPDNYNEVFSDAKLNSLTRKLWYFLVREDLTLCLSVGNHYSILDKYFDTKPPFYKEGNANVCKIDLELATIQIYKWFITRTKNIRTLVDIVSDVRGKTKVSDLADAITEMERDATTEYTFDGPYTGIQTDLMLKTYSSMRVKIVLYLKSSLISLMYHLYLYYEDKLNYELSFYYLKKMTCITLYYILPSAFDVLCGKHSKDALTLNPSLQLALHKANQVNIAAGVRVGYLVYNLEAAPDHKLKLSSDNNYLAYFNKLQELYRGFVKCGELFSSTFAKLAQKYYYAWRISKAHSSLFQILTTKQFYQSLPNNVKKMRSFQFTTQQLDELSKIARSTIKGLEQIVNFEELQRTPKDYFVPNSSLSSMSDSPPVANMGKREDFNEGNFTDNGHLMNSARNGTTTGATPVPGTTPGNIGANPNGEIDQMWMSMLAMKYNPNQGGNVQGIANGGQMYRPPYTPQYLEPQPQVPGFAPNAMGAQPLQQQPLLQPQQPQQQQQQLQPQLQPQPPLNGGGNYGAFNPAVFPQPQLFFDNEMSFDLFNNPLDPML